MVSLNYMENKTMTTYRDRLIEIVEDGMLDPMMALRMCAMWMSQDEIKNMLEAHELGE